MRPATSAEELARLAGVKAETVRRTARELLELLEHDLQRPGVEIREADMS